jgi:hypothetical protein
MWGGRGEPSGGRDETGSLTSRYGRALHLGSDQEVEDGTEGKMNKREYTLLYIFFLVVLGVELRALHLQSFFLRT